MIMITGTDTGVGKTLISTWLCLHTGFSYYKPIQTGISEGRDSEFVESLSKSYAYPEAYCFRAPVSPHLAAELEKSRIEISDISLPTRSGLVVEGAGGVYVPINESALMLDMFAHLKLPLLLVASSRLGTINHTLLSIHAIRARGLDLWGVIMMGEDQLENQKAIEHYGEVPVFSVFPWLDDVSEAALRAIPLPQALRDLLEVQS